MSSSVTPSSDFAEYAYVLPSSNLVRSIAGQPKAEPEVIVAESTSCTSTLSEVRRIDNRVTRLSPSLSVAFAENEYPDSGQLTTVGVAAVPHGRARLKFTRSGTYGALL